MGAWLDLVLVCRARRKAIKLNWPKLFCAEQITASTALSFPPIYPQTSICDIPLGTAGEGLDDEDDVHGDQLVSFEEFSAFVMTLLRTVYEQVRSLPRTQPFLRTFFVTHCLVTHARTSGSLSQPRAT